MTVLGAHALQCQQLPDLRDRKSIVDANFRTRSRQCARYETNLLLSVIDGWS